ncbi:MAG: hypothetical protein SPI59_04945 [Finegoldia sp.]|nr:hypothetical protein [Finegoldia sp.]
MNNDFKRLLESKIFFIFMFLVYRVFLDISYAYVISPLFTYMGLYNHLNFVKFIEGYLILIIMAYTIRHRVEKITDFYCVLFFLLLIVPATSIYAFKDYSRIFMYALVASFYIVQFFAYAPQVRINLSDKTISHKKILYIFATMSILMFLWILARGGLKFLNFDFTKVYDYRREAERTIFPGPFLYLMNWYGKIINPTLIALCIWDKNKIGTIISLVCQVLFFGFTSHKSMLFYPALVIFIAVVKGNKYTGNLLTTALAGLTVLCFAFYLVTDIWQPMSVIIRRVMFVTADNHFRYYEAFKDMQFVYMSDKSWVPLTYPYEYPIQALISKIYYGHPNTWVNTGFMANGYVNFGFLGMFIYSAIVGWLFGIMDEISYKKMPLWTSIAVTIVPVYNLLSVDLLTGLMYHGLLVAIILLWLLSKRKKEDEGVYIERNNFERRLAGL